MRLNIKQTIRALVLTCFASHAAANSSDEADLIRGVVRAVSHAIVTTEITARIAQMPVTSGASFAAGDVLVAFDCTRLQAELAARAASVASARRLYQNNRELIKYDSIGEYEMLQSKSDFERAAAEYKAMEATVGECEIEAPYDGRVVNTLANVFETPGPGTGLIEIIDDSELELELIVPSAWLGWLNVDSTFEFLVDETDETHSATIVQIGAMVDAVSQTVRITGKFVSPPAHILAGMSGTASFQPPAEKLAGSSHGN